MANTSMNIRMDADVKKQAEALFSEIGMNMTTAINIFLKQSIRENGLPFELKLNQPNSETIAAMEEVEEVKAHPEKYKRYSSFSELLNEVSADA